MVAFTVGGGTASRTMAVPWRVVGAGASGAMLIAMVGIDSCPARVALAIGSVILAAHASGLVALIAGCVILSGARRRQAGLSAVACAELALHVKALEDDLQSRRRVNAVRVADITERVGAIADAVAELTDQVR